jgi:peptidoglycan/LPS O-acetylase OafA/YrhL
MGAAPDRIGPTNPVAPHPAGGRDIPSLDGLRAVSIALVILAHTKTLLPPGLANSGPFRYIVGGGLAGVEVFFVISGYLITTLLLREFERTGTVSLRHFYLRRSLRIFPPFYAYLAIVALLWLAGLVPEHGPSLLAAATYSIVYLAHPQGWEIFHTWSLSVEEQFYLLWPAIFVFAHRRGHGLGFALSILAFMPLVRLLLWFAIPHAAGSPPHAAVTAGAIDTLMVGCLLALVGNRAALNRVLFRSWLPAALFVVGFVLVPWLAVKARGSGAILAAAIGVTVSALCIGGILCHVVGNPGAAAGRFLNLRVLRHIGVISYSLYLWQQLFTDVRLHLGPMCYLLMLLVAEASYWCIEKPVQRWRSRLRLGAQRGARPIPAEA